MRGEVGRPSPRGPGRAKFRICPATADDLSGAKFDIRAAMRAQALRALRSHNHVRRCGSRIRLGAVALAQAVSRPIPPLPSLPSAHRSHDRRDSQTARAARPVLRHLPQRPLKTANLSLQGLDLATVGDHAELWEKVIRKLRAGVMPPPDLPRPSLAEYEGLRDWLEAEIDRRAATRINPGSVVLHRLNRTEYANAIRDLLDLEIDVTTLLPPDDSANGFDNIAGSLTISPTLLESYATAAARVARMAVGYWKSPTEATYLALERRVAEPAPRGHAVRHARRHRRAPRFPGRRRIQVLDSELRHRQLHSRRAARAHHRRRARARLAVSRRRRRPSA